MIIDEIYKTAQIERRGKYLRFPHLDRGTGGWIVDYNAAPKHKDNLIALFTDGLNISMTPPTTEQIEQKKKLQGYLKEKGFTAPFPDVTHKFYKETEMAQALDCLYTFSTSDWMLMDRHRGKWPYATLDDIKEKIDSDKSLQKKDSAHIILIHDKEEMVPLLKNFKEIVLHFLKNDYDFQSCENL